MSDFPIFPFFYYFIFNKQEKLTAFFNMTASNSLKNKPLKWTTQRVSNNNFKSTTSNRVNKRSSGNNQTRNNTMTTAIMTAEIKSNPREEIERLQNELEFTYDTVATITVHFESLHHAYTCSKPELDKSKNATRLGEMEKELLTAYDDLGLQVTHLERKIAKLEKRLDQLRQLELVYVQPQESPLNYGLISSPCSSTDSSIADTDNQVEYSDLFYDDLVLSQFMTTNEQFNNSNDCNLMPYTDYYQELYCDLSTVNLYPYYTMQ